MLKHLIYQEEGISQNQQQLIYKGRELINQSSLCEYHIVEGSTIYLIQRLRGGSFDFNDLSIPIEIDTTKGTAKYAHRYVAPGLNFKAKCTNKACRQYKNIVYIKKGFGTFNLQKEICNS